MIELKPGVGVVMTPENVRIIEAVDSALHRFGLHAVVTAGFDGPHRLDSKHFSNAAIDFRIVWNGKQRDTVLEAIKAELPGGYRFRLESDHLHVERAIVPDNLRV